MESNQFCRRLKFIRTLLILLIMLVPFQLIMAQITLSTSRTNLGTVIKQIQAQSSYQFFYSDKLSSVTVAPLNMKNASLEAVLNSLLKGTNISYKVEDSIVYLAEKNASEVSLKADQQQQTVSGTVTDSKGEPLIGVSILVKGTENGTITNLDGNYTLTLNSPNAVLVFSYIGYQTQEIPANGRATIRVVLQEDTQIIDEVVVTALGIKRAQKALSYNVQQISEDELLKNKDANFINALSGKVAGVNINSSSSGVGGASKVVMRGSKSIAQSSNALYVIDGVPMFNRGSEGGTEHNSSGTTEAIADINPEDIESMSVLTGAAAAALYGSEAANGAIVITTKKGQAGRTSLTVTQSTEFLRPFVMPEFQNRYGTGSSLSASTERSWGSRLNDANYRGYSPKNDYLNTGVVTTETVSLSTGTDRNQTYLSAGAINSVGMVPNNDYNRYNFTFRNTTSFLNEKLLLDVGASYIKQDDKNMTNQGVYSNPLVTAYLFPRGDDWNDIKMYERYDTQRKIYTQYWPQGLNEFTGQNPYWINYRNLRVNKKDRYMMNANLTYNIFDWLNVAGRIRIDNSNNKYTEKLYASSNTTLTEGSLNGFYGISKTEDRQMYGDILININKMFLDDQLSLQANIGASISDLRQDVLENRGPIMEDGLPNVFNVYQLDNTKTKRAQTGWREQTQSLFASVELGYKSAYYLTLTGRNDWPSQLAGPQSVNSSFFYPSVGTSLILSEIFNLPEQISYMKLRASYASVGLPFARFLSNPTYVWDHANQKWEIAKTNYPIPDLKPERTTSWEVGLTMRFLKNFNLDVSYYTAKTYNQTFDPQISVSSGYSTLYIQTGSVRNQGVELALGYQNQWNNGFKWSSNYTFSANRNKILELVENYPHPETGELITKNRLDIGGLSQARFILKKGGSLGDLYSLSDLLRDENGNIYVDEKGSVTVNNSAGDIKLGSVFPKANMAWRNDFSWKGFNLGFMISARLGGVVYSATQASLDLYGVSEASAVARDNGGIWINGGDKMHPETWYSTVGANNGLPLFYTYSATNVRLQEASIGYTIPKSKLWGVSDVTISLIGRNLWMIYNKAPFDPEAVATTGNYYQGIDYFMMPSTRNLGFNVRLKF